MENVTGSNLVATNHDATRTDVPKPVYQQVIPQTSTAAKQQASRPSAMEVTKYLGGNALLTTGAILTGLTWPVTIPLAIFGAGAGFIIGKGIETFVKDAPSDAGVTGAKIGGALGGHLVAACFVGGVTLRKEAYAMKQDRKIEAKKKPEVITNGELLSEDTTKEIALKQQEIEKLFNDVKYTIDLFDTAVDTEGVKAILIEKRTALENGNDGVIGEDHEVRIQAGEPFKEVFVEFNKEIPLRKEIAELQTAYKKALAEKAGTKVYQPILDQKRAKVDSLKFLEMETNLAYLKAIAIDKIEINAAVNEAKIPLSSTPGHRVKINLINIMEKYESTDPLEVEEAKNKIDGLSQQNRNLLIDLFNGKFITEEKLTNLEKALNQTPTTVEFSRSRDSKISSVDVLNHIQAALKAPALATVNASYPTDGKGIVDLAYANAETQSLFLVDGSGHNHPQMAKVLKEIMDPFMANYTEEFKKMKFTSAEECAAFMTSHLEKLNEAIRANTSPIFTEEEMRENNILPEANKLSFQAYNPIGALAQVININGKVKVVHIRKGDMMLVIKDPHGNVTFGDSEKGSTGSLAIEGTEYEAEIIEIQPGSQVAIVSDGGGELMKLDKFKKVIEDNENPHLLIDELKVGVFETGIETTLYGKAHYKEPAANGKFLHYYNPTKYDDNDDISVSWLRTPEADEQSLEEVI